MNLRINGVELSFGKPESSLSGVVSGLLNVPEEAISRLKILRRAVDAASPGLPGLFMSWKWVSRMTSACPRCRKKESRRPPLHPTLSPCRSRRLPGEVVGRSSSGPDRPACLQP